ncbi:type VI secretion system baseplate subunit TssK [Siccibacter colletis]|uniref:Type VI secretion system baseplate subunit TssK n=1 Tax=Siccibacter colletis TaxID=1505757 RepID=A0ABY6JDF1_9ENTR|nr:type VI secretion system baseplate subunit TssK [Siccibacter colletis]
MSVNTETTPAKGNTTVLENTAGDSVYTSLFKKINLTPASRLGDINDFLDDSALAEASTSERLTAAMQVFLNCIRQSGQNVDKLDKTLIDRHIAELDHQISRQLDAVMHHDEFQKVESLWRGLKQLVDIPAWQIAEKFPALCQAGSPDEVSEIYGAALKGIPLIPVSRVPAALPVRMENQYFALDMESPAAHEMQEQGVCMFYVPELLGALELELFAVLRS